MEKMCACVFGSANNSCQQNLCSHLCLAKQGYPGFTCACPNAHDGLTYSLDGRGLQCIATPVPTPGECNNDIFIL